MKKQWKRIGALLFAGAVALSSVFGTQMNATETLAVSAEENMPVWSLDKITVSAGSGMIEDLNYGVQIQNAVTTYGLQGAIALPPETAELLEYPYGEADSCWMGDVYPESRFLSNTNLIHEGRIDFSLDTSIPEAPAVSSGTLMQITIAIPAEETVVAVAASYDMPLQEEQGTYFYEFPVNWMEYGYDVGISSGEAVSIPRFSYVDALNQEIFLDQVQLENGYIRVTVAPPEETTTTTTETEPTTTEATTTTASTVTSIETTTTTESTETTTTTTTAATTTATTESSTSTEAATSTSSESTRTEAATETTTQTTTETTVSTTESTTSTTESTTPSASTTTFVTTETTVQENGEIQIEVASVEITLEELRMNHYQIEIPVRAVINSGFNQLQFGGAWNPEELTLERGYGTGYDLLCINNVNSQTNDFVWFSFMSLMGYSGSDLCSMIFTVSDTAQAGDVYEVQLAYAGSGDNIAGASFQNVPLTIELTSSIIKIIGAEETTTTTEQTMTTTIEQTTTTTTEQTTTTTTQQTTTTTTTTSGTTETTASKATTAETTTIDTESTTTTESSDTTTAQSTLTSTSRTDRTTASEPSTVETTTNTTTTETNTTTNITTSETTATTTDTTMTTVSLYLEVEEPDASQLYVGNSFRLLCHTNASGIVWSSSNHEIATIDADGMVTIHGSGVVYVIAAAQADLTKTDTIALTIPEPLVTTASTTMTETETTTTSVETTTETTADTTVTTTSVSIISTADTTTESTTNTTEETTGVEVSILRGDADMNGEIEIADAFQVLLYSSMHSAGKDDYTFQADAGIEAELLRQVNIDGDGEIAIADAFYILLYNSMMSAGATDFTWDDVLA